jgi:flagellar hook-basal body complex protein FliE
MVTTPSFATTAYRAAQGLANQAGLAQSGKAGGLPDFSAMVKDAVSDVVQQGRASEQKSLSMASGKTDVVDVVTAVAETEMALETLVSVRDRVITAYEEIMRMPI